MPCAHWPYLIRVLLKAGWTVEGLAHAADTSQERIKDYMSGRRNPEAVKAALFRRMINSHKRDGLTVRPPGDVIPLIPVEAIPDGVPEPLPRGVFEDPSPPAGYRQFRAIAEDGTELVNLRFHWRAEERDVVPGLRAWLNRSDPIIRLLDDASDSSS